MSGYKTFFFLLLQVHQGDRLSARVCHACISYLNSWQSFKNRCYAAQKKQRGMLDLFLAKERARLKNANQQHNQAPAVVAANAQRQMEQYRQQLEQQRILKDALSQPSGSSGYKNTQNNSVSMDVVCNDDPLFFTVCPTNFFFPFSLQSFIKSEPADDIQNDAEVEDDDEMDPSQFLARDNDDDEPANEEEGGGPPILTSLGLTHINHVNPYSFLVSKNIVEFY